MPIDPTIALQTRPMPNPLEQYSQAIGIQQQQIQLQQQKQALKDQQTLRDLFVKNQGDLDKVIKDAPGAGVSPNTLIQLQQHSLDVKTKLSQLTGEQLKNSATQNDNLIGVLKPVQDAPADKKAEAYQASYTKVLQNPQMYGITDPSQIPQQYPGDEAIKQQILLHQGGKTQFENAMKEREVGAQEQAAQARGGVDMALYLSLLKQGKSPQEAFAQVKQQAQQGKQPPLPQPQIDNLNKILSDRYSVLNPGKPVPPQYTLQAGATQKDFDTIDKGLEQVEKAQGVKAQQDTAAATRAQAEADKQEKEGLQAVVGTDANGNRVLASMSEAKKLGLTGMTKADADLQNKAEAARHWLTLATKKAPDNSPPEQMGIMQLIDKMDKEGKLGVVASRWNDFMAGKVGTGDPEFTALRAKMGLSSTKLMQAHVGSRGGAFMLEHFEDLANAKKMDAKTLRAGVGSELDYMQDVAMLPSSTLPANKQKANIPSAPAGMLNVQLADGTTGTIKASMREKFLKDNKGSKVIE